jgi:hypothetical protein
MRKTVSQRLANYVASIQPDHLKSQIEQKRDAMIARMTEVIGEQAQIENLVTGVLADEDVVTILYPAYLCYGRELAAKQRRFKGGKGLNKEAAVVLAKWLARGLVESVLVRIRNDVFSIPEPVA